jgi:diadenosine tetraphosphate (Ap4A) HIT family hydrolase
MRREFGDDISRSHGFRCGALDGDVGAVRVVAHLRHHLIPRWSSLRIGQQDCAR